ncbi:MAG TPA: endo-1,4-beta-xylanase, partial [Acidobacteriaceae bacterium]
EATISAFEKLGVKVAISELDVDVLPRATRNQGADVSLRVQQDPVLNPYGAGLPDSVQQQLSRRYADLFRVYLAHRDAVTRITLWGVTDQDSWLNNWPVSGRTSYPLLFDRKGNPKPAFFAVVKTASESAQ